MTDIQRLRRSLAVMVDLHAKRPAVFAIIERLVVEIETAEALALVDPVTRARSMLSAA